MKKRARVWAFGAVALSLGIWSLATAADDNKDANDALVKLAEAIEKKDDAGIKKASEALKKVDLDKIMKAMALPKNGGLGVGAAKEGIEAKLIALGKKAMDAKALAKDADSLAKACYVMAAIAEVSKDKCPVTKKQGDKDPKMWVKWSEDMKAASIELATTLKGGKPDMVKTVASKLNSSCNNCHSPFRE